MRLPPATSPRGRASGNLRRTSNRRFALRQAPSSDGAFSFWFLFAAILWWRSIQPKAPDHPSFDELRQCHVCEQDADQGEQVLVRQRHQVERMSEMRYWQP